MGTQFEEGSNQRNAFSLRVRPPNPWKKSEERNLTRAEIEIVRAQLESARRNLEIEVSRLYYKAHYYELLVETAKQEGALLATLHATYQEQLSRGNVRLSDALNAQTKFAEARIELSDIEQEERDAIIKLFHWLGVIWNPQIRLTTTFVEPGDSLPFAGFDEENPYLREWDLRQQALQVEIRLERRAETPWIRFVQGSYATDAGRSDENEWAFLMGISLPFFKRNW